MQFVGLDYLVFLTRANSTGAAVSLLKMLATDNYQCLRNLEVPYASRFSASLRSMDGEIVIAIQTILSLDRPELE
jgi:hypothetical protein